MSLAEARATLRGRRVLVTGGGGFVGGRLVERLVEECGAEVRVLVRNLAGAMRLARYPLDFRRGDVLDREAVRAAASECDAVFHCAYGTTGSQRQRARVNRDGTRCVLETARAAGCRRLVHLSTLMVYGRTADGDLDESASRRRFGNAYSDSKLDAERLVVDAARRGLQTVVLQPTAVYGPYGGVWTERVLTSMKAGKQILVDGGSGLANFVYVDDLVSAMLLAATVDRVAGETFLISSEEPVTWREWFGRFERMLGGERTVTMTAEAARAHWRAWRRARPRLMGEMIAALRGERALRERLFETPELRFAREAASALLPERWQQRIKSKIGMGAAAHVPVPPPVKDLPVLPLQPSEIDFYLPRTRVRIDRAQRLLGYRPSFDLDAGMALTEAWARWANLT